MLINTRIVRVQWGDCDPAGIVFYPRYFEWFDASTILLFESLDERSLDRSGIADGNRSTVRALAYHIAGHEIRHRNVIRERYLAFSPR